VPWPGFSLDERCEKLAGRFRIECSAAEEKAAGDGTRPSESPTGLSIDAHLSQIRRSDAEPQRRNALGYVYRIDRKPRLLDDGSELCIRDGPNTQGDVGRDFRTVSAEKGAHTLRDGDLLTSSPRTEVLAQCVDYRRRQRVHRIIAIPIRENR
jgi:hypothetical protein